MRRTEDPEAEPAAEPEALPALSWRGHPLPASPQRGARQPVNTAEHHRGAKVALEPEDACEA